MTIEISTNTRNYVRNNLKSGVDIGLIPSEEYRAVLSALKGNAQAKGKEARAAHLLTSTEASKLLSCCSKTIHRMADKGLLQRVYLEAGNPKSLRFKSAEVAAIVAGEVC